MNSLAARNPSFRHCYHWWEHRFLFPSSWRRRGRQLRVISLADPLRPPPHIISLLRQDISHREEPTPQESKGEHEIHIAKSASSVSRINDYGNWVPSPLPVCRQAYAPCENGMVRNHPVWGTIDCASFCKYSGKECCAGDSACYAFTGKIRMDGSCSGVSACENAVIPAVVNFCKGEWACLYGAGNFDYEFPGDRGIIGNIVNSCNAHEACYHAGDWSNGILEMDLMNCCNEEFECVGASNHYYRDWPGKCAADTI